MAIPPDSGRAPLNVVPRFNGVATILLEDAPAGSSSLRVSDVTGFSVDDKVWIGTPGNIEQVTIQSISTSTKTINLSISKERSHTIGAPVMTSPSEIVDARRSYDSLGDHVTAIRDVFGFVAEELENRGLIGYASATANQAGITTSLTDLTDLVVTKSFTGRPLKISWLVRFSIDTVPRRIQLRLRVDGTQVENQQLQFSEADTSQVIAGSMIYTPTAGNHTFQLNAAITGGSANAEMIGASNSPSQLIIEDIGDVTSEFAWVGALL